MSSSVLNARMVQVIKSRPADWISGYPVTDDLGRLQVKIMKYIFFNVHVFNILYLFIILLVTIHLFIFQIIKNNDLEELQELGSGTFGTVYHGKWRGSDVAIKRINDRCFAGKPSEQDKMVCLFSLSGFFSLVMHVILIGPESLQRNDFWNEASKLADLHHPNVVAFYGVVLDGPGGSIATVTEYMVNGSLRTALLKNAKYAPYLYAAYVL